MKIFKLMTLALVAMLGFNSCSEDCDHDFIEVDYSKDLVGTWTCMDMDYAEAIVIKADGSVEVAGVVDHEYFESKGTIKVVNNKMIYKLDNGDEFVGRFEMTKGESFTMVWDDELDIRYTYRYCANDLADEIVGMWVDNGANENEIVIQTYQEDGKVIRTGYVPGIDALAANYQATYKVIGDLLFVNSPSEILGEKEFSYAAVRLTYLPNGTSLGDIMTYKKNIPFGDDFKEEEMTFLRIKQSLDLTGIYDYTSAYVSNAKGTDEDFTILGHTFNIANITGGNFDMLFRSELFYIDLNANSIKQYYRLDIGQNIEIEIPITVDGNKVTLDMSNEHSAYRKVDFYMFQDADNSQLHMYMHTDAFINYFANMELYNLLSVGKINPDDTAAIEKVFSDMEARIQSINVSFVMKARK